MTEKNICLELNLFKIEQLTQFFCCCYFETNSGRFFLLVGEKVANIIIIYGQQVSCADTR